jgi:serine/threonine protein kinase
MQFLGRGGNAITYLVNALDGPNRGLFFAAKIFTKVSSAERTRRFIEEASVLQTLSHDAVMAVVDEGYYIGAGTDDWIAYPFLVAEYLPQTLVGFLGARSRLITKIAFAVQLIAGVAYLASRNILHRDIKPQNIFVNGGSCVIGDLGLHKRLDLTAAQDAEREAYITSILPAMAFYYRTPEIVAYHAEGRALDVRSDVFQLGLVLAHLFSGQNPLQTPEAALDPVHLNPITRIGGDYRLRILGLLNSMLTLQVDRRPNAVELVPQWQQLLFDVTDAAARIEGRAF